MKENVLFPLKGTTVQQHLLIVILVLFFVIPCNLILHKINVQILKRKKKYCSEHGYIQDFYGRPPKKTMVLEEVVFSSQWVAFPLLSQCCTSSTVLEVLRFRWNGKAKCCGHQRFPRKNSVPRNSYSVLQFYLSEVHIISAAEDFAGWCSCISWQYTHPRVAAFYWFVK